MKNKILTQNQILFLKKAGEDKFISRDFYLSGGTALASFYLKHRYSEDLDFFSEKEIDPLAIIVFLKKIKKDLGIRKFDYSQSFNRNLFFLHLSDEILKTEFTFFPFPCIEQHERKFGFLIDSLVDIAVNKLFSIYQRTTARDYIDLYFICKRKGFTIIELIKLAKIKFDWHIDPIQLGSQFLKSQEAKDMPRLLKDVPKEKWQKFFIAEAKKFENEIFKE